MRLNTEISPENRNIRQFGYGILIVLIARLAMSMVVLLSRFAASTLSMAEIIFFQNGISFLCLIPFFFKFGLASLKMENYWHLLVRIVFGLLAFIFLLLSAQKISITGAILLNNAAPLFVPFVVLVWRKVPINHRLWAGMIIGFVGLAFVLQPWKMSNSGLPTTHMYLGLLYGVLSGLSLSIALVSMRVLRFSRMFPILFFYYLFASLVTFPFAIVEWTNPSLSNSWLLIAIGVLTLVTQGGYLKAFKYGKASNLSPFFYVAVIYGALFDWMFFNKFPGIWMIFGIVFLIIGGILVIICSKKETQ